MYVVEHGNLEALPLATVSLVTMETQKSLNEDLCESDSGIAPVGSSAGYPSDRKSAIVVHKDDGSTVEVDSSETTVTTETRLDVSHEPIVVKECPVKNICTLPKDLPALQSEQHVSSEDDDEEDDADDDALMSFFAC